MYMGGKERLGREIAAIINKFIQAHGAQSYFEPFCGMGGVAQYIVCHLVLLSDANPSTLLLMRAMVSGKPHIQVPTSVTKQEWVALRNGRHTVTRAVVGISTSFSGNMFSGFIGNEKERTRRLGIASRTLARKIKLFRSSPSRFRVTARARSYDTFSPRNAVIYCDPPYENTRFYRGHKFCSKTFWEVMERWAKHNVVLVSERTPRAGWRVVMEKKVKRNYSKGTDVVEYLLQKGKLKP